MIQIIEMSLRSFCEKTEVIWFIAVQNIQKIASPHFDKLNTKRSQRQKKKRASTQVFFIDFSLAKKFLGK